MRLHLIIAILLLLNMGCIPKAGHPGPKGDTGHPGPKGDTGLRGPAGKSIPAKQLKQLEAIFAREGGEIIVGTESYSFGLAPRITGFCFLTNQGRLFKLKNKNTQILGETILEIGKIADRDDFTYLVRSAYGDDVKQYFLAVTQSGLIYASEDLEAWKQLGEINFD